MMVKDVLKILAERGSPCAEQSFHECLSKALHGLADEQATALGVDLTLLRAVRQRLRLPLAPPTDATKADSRRMGRFYARGRQRPVWLKKPKSAPGATVLVPASGPTPPVPARSRPSLSIPAAVPTAAPGEWAPDQIARPTLREWKQINERARARLPDHILPNWHGTVMDMKTDLPLEIEDFRGLYGLSEQEAKTLYMTL